MPRKLSQFFISFVLIIFFTQTAYAQGNVLRTDSNTISSRMNYLENRSSSVVHIFSGSVRRMGQGAGTVIKDQQGRFRILTNNHVLGSMDNFEAWVAFVGEKRMRKLRIIGRDPLLDLAILEVPSPLPFGVENAPLGSSRSLKVGDKVYAVGYPLGVRSVSFGYINARKSTKSHLLFTSQVPLLPGNSGGPLFLFNKEGIPEVIGINTMIIRIGLSSLSIHIDYVKKVLPRLNRESEVVHASLGIIPLDTKDFPPPIYEQITRSSYDSMEDGIVVASLKNGGSAAKAGIQRGDMILGMEFKGDMIPFRNARELRDWIFFEFRVGDEVLLKTKRGSQTFNRRIVLGKASIEEFGGKIAEDQ